MKNQNNVAFHKLVIVGALTALFFLGAPKSALAHARLERSSPAADSEAAKAPAQIELWFSELLDDGFNSISVFAAADTDPKTRKNLALGDAKVDAKDRTHLINAVNPLPPGDYVVEWRVLSLDGHSAPGKFKFKVSAAK
jgi:methionine-rich copper-binding protein CopC